MRTITKTHQASGKSMILNPSVRIEPVRTDSRGRGIDVDGSNVYREQRAGRYTFRSSVVVERQILFGALIRQADDGLSLASPERLHSATVCPAENAHKRLRAFFSGVTYGGGAARLPRLADTVEKVENRTAPKISRRSIARSLRRCAAL
jgi:hypothetical protein